MPDRRRHPQFGMRVRSADVSEISLQLWDASAVQPRGFDARSGRMWDEWVLDNGLPELPAGLMEGQSVPIAYWSGPECGAVVSLIDCDHDPYCGPEEHYVTDVRCFRRLADSWEVARGSTGTEWEGGVSTHVELPDDHVTFDGPCMTTGWDFEWCCFTVTGFAGRDAVWIELIQPGMTIRRPINSPTGLFVVALSAVRPAEIIVLDADREVRGSYLVPTPRAT